MRQKSPEPYDNAVLFICVILTFHIFIICIFIILILVVFVLVTHIFVIFIFIVFISVIRIFIVFVPVIRIFIVFIPVIRIFVVFVLIVRIFVVFVLIVRIFVVFVLIVRIFVVISGCLPLLSFRCTSVLPIVCFYHLVIKTQKLQRVLSDTIFILLVESFIVITKKIFYKNIFTFFPICHIFFIAFFAVFSILHLSLHADEILIASIPFYTFCF